MNLALLQDFILSLGFPIVVSIGFAWFIRQLWNDQREDKNQILNALCSAQEQNKQLCEANRGFMEVLKEYRGDIHQIKDDIKEIKVNILKNDF